MIRLALILTVTLLILEALAPQPTANDICPDQGPVDASVVNAVCR